MVMNPQMGAAAAAGGMPPQQGGMPQQPPQGGMPPQQGMEGGQVPVQQIIEALKQAIPQVIDQNGYVDMNKLIMLWPNISPDIPFSAVVQLVQQMPELLTDLVAQFGLAGIIVNGKVTSGDELAALGGKGA